MERRDYLKIAGASGVAAVGAYGAYTTVIRDAWSDPSNVDLSTIPADELENDVDARDGWKLLGITPETRDLSVLDPFEEWLGKQHAIVGFFLDIGQPNNGEIDRLVNDLFESAWQRNQIPHVFWQPFLPDQDQTSDNVNREIADGEWDEEIETWANVIASWIYDEDGEHR